MDAVIIKTYVSSWHPKNNKGIIKLKLENDKTVTWHGKDPAEFSAILSILSSAEEPFVTKDGWISTGKEEPDADSLV